MINISLSVILAQFMGIVGVAIGTLAANIFRTVQYAVYIDRNLVKRGPMAFLGHIIWTFANTAVIGGCSYFLAEKYAYNGWIAWILIAVIIVLIGIIISLITSFIFYRQEFYGVLNIALRITKLRMKRKKKIQKENEEDTKDDTTKEISD